MKFLDRFFSCLLIVGGIAHAFGAWSAFHSQPATLLWSEAAFAIFLLAAINLLRSARPADRALAWISFAGCLVWAGFALAVGGVRGDFLYSPAIANVVDSLVLANFSLHTAIRPAARPLSATR
jgi:hypothetical protein